MLKTRHMYLAIEQKMNWRKRVLMTVVEMVVVVIVITIMVTVTFYDILYLSQVELSSAAQVFCL